jgi:hypothetical protein
MDKYNLDDLNTTTFKTPQTTVASPVPVLGGYMDTMISDIQKQEQAKLKETESQRTDITDIMKVLGQEGQMREQLFQESGVDVARKAVDEYTSAIEAEQLAMRRQLEKTRMTFGGTTAGLQDELGRVERESLAKQADLAILQNASLRNYETMSNIAERKVQALLQPYKTQLDVTKFLYEENKQDLTKAQDRLWSQKVKQEEREFEKTENELRESNNMILNAIQGNAPKTTIAKAQEMANAGKSPTEIANYLGQYSLSADQRLERRYKEAQIASIYDQMAERQSNLSVGDQIKLQEQAAQEKTKIDTFTDILALAGRLKDNPDLRKATGINSLITLPGSKAFEIKRTANQLINTLAKGNLDQMKGAMSDKDIEFLRNINSSLAMGMSTRAFIAELDRISTKVSNRLLEDYGIGYKPSITDMNDDELLQVANQETSNAEFFSR